MMRAVYSGMMEVLVKVMPYAIILLTLECFNIFDDKRRLGGGHDRKKCSDLGVLSYKSKRCPSFIVHELGIFM
jgi:hypothetical protein